MQVREALHFSARLRLSTAVSPAKRTAYVAEVLRLLELEPIADRLVRVETGARAFDAAFDVLPHLSHVFRRSVSLEPPTLLHLVSASASPLESNSAPTPLCCFWMSQQVVSGWGATRLQVHPMRLFFSATQVSMRALRRSSCARCATLLALAALSSAPFTSLRTRSFLRQVRNAPTVDRLVAPSIIFTPYRAAV